MTYIRGLTVLSLILVCFVVVCYWSKLNKTKQSTYSMGHILTIVCHPDHVNWNGKVIRMTALVFTGDVEACLQRLQWRPGQSSWWHFHSIIYHLTPTTARPSNAFRYHIDIIISPVWLTDILFIQILDICSIIFPTLQHHLLLIIVFFSSAMHFVL